MAKQHIRGQACNIAIQAADHPRQQSDSCYPWRPLSIALAYGPFLRIFSFSIKVTFTTPSMLNDHALQYDKKRTIQS